MAGERQKISGHGGFWVLPNPHADEDGQPANVIQHNAEYELVTESETREVRSAGCRGWAEGLHKVKRVATAFFRVADTDVLYPQALGFTEGATMPTLWLKNGATEFYDLLEARLMPILGGRPW